MKSFYLIIVFIFIACDTPNTETTATSTQSLTFDWLLGKWERVDEVEGKFTFEVWTKNEMGHYLGHGMTTLDVDTIFEERMKIYKPNDDWVLEISGVNEDPTIFTFINQSSRSFASYNSENEFPKKIEYFMEQNYLRAVISDDITKIPFKFRKVGEDI